MGCGGGWGGIGKGEGQVGIRWVVGVRVLGQESLWQVVGLGSRWAREVEWRGWGGRGGSRRRGRAMEIPRMGYEEVKSEGIM